MSRADQRKFHYIYKITRTDGRYYIGLHSTDDMNDGYFGSGRQLWYSIKKHGKHAHAKQVLEHLSSRKLLKQREKELVTLEQLQDPLCMNLCLGGGGRDDFTMTAETRAKLSVKAQQRQPRKQSDEERAKRSATLKGKAKSPEHIANSVAAKLANLTEETRWKLGSGNRGKTQSAKINAKRSASLIAANANMTDDQREERTKKRKASWSPERRAAAAARLSERHAAKRLTA